MTLKIRYPEDFEPVHLRINTGTKRNLCYWIWPRGKKYFESTEKETKDFISSLIHEKKPTIRLNSLQVVSTVLDDTLNRQVEIWKNLLGGVEACRVFNKE